MDETRLQQILQRYARELRLERTGHAFFRWLPWGAALAVVVACGCKILAASPAFPVAVAVAALPCLASAWAYRRLPAPLTVAAELDRRLSLHERVVTAADRIERQLPPTDMASLHLRDTLFRIEHRFPGDLFPVRVPSRAWRALVAVPLLAAVLLSPPWHVFATRAEPTVDTAAVAAAANRLDKMVEELSKPRLRTRLSTQQRARLSGDLRDLARALQTSTTPRSEALARIATAQERAQQLQRELAAPAADHQPTNEQGHGVNGQGAAGRDISEAQLRSMAQRLRQKSAPDAAERQHMRQQLEQAASSMSPEMRAAAARAAQSLQQNQPQQAAQALEDALAAQHEDEHELSQIQQQLSQASSAVSQEVSQAGQQMAGATPGGDQPLPGGEELFHQGSSHGDSKKSDKSGKSDFGVGSTNREDDQQRIAAPRKDYVLERQGKQRSKLLGAYEKLYTPERHEAQHAGTQMHGQLQRGPLVGTRQQVRGAPHGGDHSSLPAQRVYASHRRQAEEVVAGDSIPGEYRDLIRNYFDDIDPR